MGFAVNDHVCCVAPDTWDSLQVGSTYVVCGTRAHSVQVLLGGTDALGRNRISNWFSNSLFEPVLKNPDGSVRKMMNIERVGEFVYRVESEKTEGKFYFVDVTPGRDVECNCTGFCTKRNSNNSKSMVSVVGAKEWRRPDQAGRCKHVDEILEYHHKTEEQKQEVDSATASLLKTYKSMSK